MGHADARTTHRYVHYKPRRREAERLSKAFTVETADELVAPAETPETEKANE